MQLIKAKTKRNSNSRPLLEEVHELYEGQFSNLKTSQITCFVAVVPILGIRLKTLSQINKLEYLLPCCYKEGKF